MLAHTESPRLMDVPGRQHGLALIISIGFHLLLFWLAAEYLLGTRTSTPHTQPRSIRLSLSSANSGKTNSNTQRNDQPTSGTDEAKAPKADTTPAVSRQKVVESSSPPNRKPANSIQSTHESHEQISSARIMATAKHLAQKIAAEDDRETQPTEPTIASTLEKALNRQRETPGVSRLSDGTIRVVTQFGITYCLKPKDDIGILGPEDDMPVSVSCR